MKYRVLPTKCNQFIVQQTAPGTDDWDDCLELVEVKQRAPFWRTMFFPSLDKAKEYIAEEIRCTTAVYEWPEK